MRDMKDLGNRLAGGILVVIVLLSGTALVSCKNPASSSDTKTTTQVTPEEYFNSSDPYMAYPLTQDKIQIISKSVVEYIQSQNPNQSISHKFSCTRHDLATTFCSASYVTDGGTQGGLAFTVSTEGRDFAVLAHKKS